jgi:hypothetical protein
VYEAKLGSAIQEATNIPCACNEYYGELMRGIRGHFVRYIDDLKDQDLKRAQLGLAHSYSRAKVGSARGAAGAVASSSRSPWLPPAAGHRATAAPEVAGLACTPNPPPRPLPLHPAHRSSST